MPIYDISGNNIGTGLMRCRILEYNIGNFSNGATSGYVGNDLDEYISEWARFIGASSADICLLTETREHIDSDNVVTAQNGLYAPLYKHVTVYNPSENWGAGLLTTVPQKEKQTVIFENQPSGGGQSKFVGALLSLNGIEVYVVSAHLTHGGSSESSVRALQMQELISKIANYDNVILGGDFNTDNLDELAPFESAGFIFANGSVFGVNNTAPTDNPNNPLDNVGCRGNKLHLCMFAPDKNITLSDHIPSIAEILIG